MLIKLLACDVDVKGKLEVEAQNTTTSRISIGKMIFLA
jgi:hypothetical protein